MSGANEKAQKIIPDILQKLLAEYPPQKVILFGSYKQHAEDHGRKPVGIYVERISCAGIAAT